MKISDLMNAFDKFSLYICPVVTHDKSVKELDNQVIRETTEHAENSITYFCKETINAANYLILKGGSLTTCFLVIGCLLLSGANTAAADETALGLSPLFTYTIQQISNNRYLDAHEHGGEDFRLVTRPAQDNSTQRWKLTPLGNDRYTIQQVSNNRFVDAHEHEGEDFRLVTRPSQNNNTQRWKLTPLGNDGYTIQQVSNNRFVDAHEHAGEDFRLVTRPAQNNDTQRWRIKPINIHTIQQVSNNRFVDAHQHAGQDFRLVTRSAQNNNTQRWKFTHLGNDRYTIQQVSNSRFVDAHEHAGEDFRLVTRPAQNNNTQKWKLTPLGNDRYTIQQVSNNRFVDAHEHAGEDFRLVTRPVQNNNTQRWILKPVTFEAKARQVTISRHNTVALSNDRGDTILTDASTVLQVDAGSNDITCVVTLGRSGNIGVFNTGDGSLDTSQELSAVFGLPGNVKIVDDVNYCANQFNSSYIGCGQTPGTSFIVERFSANQEGILWLHEFGHNQGLPHRDTSNNNVMFSSIGTNRQRVNLQECSAYTGQGGQVASINAEIPIQNSGGSATMPVKEFVSQIYFDGLPLDQAATYSEDDADILLAMLNDQGQTRYHENIALTLGMIGSVRAVEPLITYIRTGEAVGNETEMARPAYKGRVGAIVALGYLVNLSSSEKALSFLMESTSLTVWEQRNIKGLSTSADKRRDMSKYSIISLGLSGNPKAAAHLRSLSVPDQAHTTEEASFMTRSENVLSQSLKLNEKISSEGLHKYYSIKK